MTNVFICQEFTLIKVSIAYHRDRKVRIKQTNNPKAFNDYSQLFDDVYESLEDYNATKKSVKT